MPDYKHKEAFALMWYACACGHRERVWNSRDGVTPYGGGLCISCGGKGLDDRGLRHTDFHLDFPAPDHKLHDGQLYFRDGTPEEAVAIIKRRIKAIDAAAARKVEPFKPIPDDVKARLLDDARNCTGEWNKGWPWSERWKAP